MSNGSMGTQRKRPDFARNASAGSNALAGTLIGFVSGVAAGWIMNRFQHGWLTAASSAGHFTTGWALSARTEFRERWGFFATSATWRWL